MGRGRDRGSPLLRGQRERNESASDNDIPKATNEVVYQAGRGDLFGVPGEVECFRFATAGGPEIGGVVGLGYFARRLTVLTHPSLLVVDEIGYLPVNHAGAVRFFQLMNRRYEQVSTVLTSNKGFEEWGEILGDDVMAAALIDRLLHHWYLVNIRGNSYRMRGHAELHLELQPDGEETDTLRRARRSMANGH